jgi:Tfp pilus assembly protein PilZ
MANSVQNRREFPRQRRENSVKYSRMDSEEYHDARLIDLGEGGLCMETCAPLRTGEVIYLQLLNMHPEKQGLAAHRSFQGRVRWTRDMGCSDKTRYGIGVQYTRPVSRP